MSCHSDFTRNQFRLSLVLRSKPAIFTILEVLNFDFWKYFTLENVKNSQKFRDAQMIKMVVFFIDSNQFNAKSDSQKIPEISTLCTYSKLGCSGL